MVVGTYLANVSAIDALSITHTENDYIEQLNIDFLDFICRIN